MLDETKSSRFFTPGHLEVRLLKFRSIRVLAATVSGLHRESLDGAGG